MEAMTTAVPGSKLTMLPTLSMAVHCVVTGHASAVRAGGALIVVGVGIPGAVGSKVHSSFPVAAVHWVVDGHATVSRPMPLWIVTGVGVPGDWGSNVNSCPR